jgi:hypothetical protein
VQCSVECVCVCANRLEPLFLFVQVRALVHVESKRCLFNVELFRDQKDNVFVEFQKRNGDTRELSSVYHSVLWAMSDAGLVREPLSPRYRTSEPTAMPTDLVSDSVVVSNSIRGIFHMATSNMVDVQREGMSALATISSGDRSDRNLIFLEENYFPSSDEITSQPFTLGAILEMGLSSADSRLVHATSVVASNVSDTYHPKELIDRLWPIALGVLQAPYSLETVDTKRQIATMLVNMSLPLL